MRTTIAFSIGCLLAVTGRGQQVTSPAIEWQHVFGGTEREILHAIHQTRDGGFILGGGSESPPGGNKTAPTYSGYDFWVVRLDPQGHAIWDRSFGGTGFDYLTSLQETVDEGVVIGGASQSGIGGNKTTPHFGTIAEDFWVIGLDASGNKVWEQNLGGTYSDILRRVRQTADGSLILFGNSGSPPSGNKTATNWGNADFWVVCLEKHGTMRWDRSFGGSYNEYLWDGQQTLDGGFILGGASLSPPSGNKTSPSYGSTNYYLATADFWVVRLDADGNKLWDRSFGGMYDDTLYCLDQTPDGGFILAGRSESPPSGNKTSRNYGNSDCWVVRLDADGNKLWDQTFGGTDSEWIYSLDVTTEGGVILGGWSSSGVNGNKTSPNFGGTDCWVIRLDADGQKVWEATYGGSRTDELQSLQQTRDGGFILGGWSWSPADGNKTVPAFSFGDYWVVKLGPEQPQLRFLDPPVIASGSRLALNGIKNLTYAVDWSTDLEVWTTLQTNRMGSGSLEFQDPAGTNFSQRFYRARLVADTTDH